MDGFKQDAQFKLINHQASQKRFRFSRGEDSPSFDGSTVLKEKQVPFKDSTDSNFRRRNSKDTQQISLHSSNLSSFENADENLNYSSEIAFLRRKLESMEAEKELHITNHAREKEKLNSQISELKVEIKDLTKNSKREICSLKEQCRSLETELDSLKEISVQKIQYYKKKFQSFENKFRATVYEKECVISNLNAKLAHRDQTPRRKKNRTPVPASGRHTHRDTAPKNERLEDIRTMIVNLEASQAEYKQLQHKLLKAENPSDVEVERVNHMLKSNEFKLREAKTLQDHVMRTTFDK